MGLDAGHRLFGVAVVDEAVAIVGYADVGEGIEAEGIGIELGQADRGGPDGPRSEAGARALREEVASRAQLEKGRLMPVMPEIRAIWDAMRPFYQSVMNGEQSPEDAARAMQARAAEMIEVMRE